MAGENDDLTIEVTGSSQKAESALDRVKRKLDEMQAAFDKAAPSASKFAAQMDKIAASSKAFSAFQKLTEGTNRQALSAKNAESRMAMYQARLDRANVSMERSRVQSEKLATSLGKVSALQNIAEHNNSAFSMPESEFSRRFNSNSGDRGINLTPDIPTDTFEPTPAPGTARLASEMPQFSKASINIDTTRARFAVQQLGAFIDNLNPTVSHMSTEAQAKFNALAERLMHVGQEIDNQRALYHNLATESGRVASAAGESSAAYLRLEKRMLSATGAIDRLVTKQDKLKAQMSDIAGVADETGAAMTVVGSKAETAGRKTESGWSKALGMFERMGIRIAAFRAFSAIQQGIATGIQNMAQASPQANATMSQLATSIQYIENSIAAALMPLLQALTPIIVQIADGVAWLGNQIAIFIAQVTDQKTVTIATKSYVDYAKSLNKSGDNASEASKKVKELQRTIMGFDELNVLQKNVDAIGGGKVNTPDYGSMFKTIPTPASDFSNLFNNVPKVFDKLKDSADKGGKALDNVKGKAKELQSELEKIKLPELGSWKIPVFPRVSAPAIDTSGYDKSREWYQRPVPSPAFERPVAPAIDLERSFFPSMSSAKKGLADWETETQQSMSKWKTTVETNFASVFAYNKNVVIASNPQTEAEINKGFSADLKSSANWGTAFMTNLRSVAVFISTVFPSPLKAANDAFNSFFSTSNKNAIGWGSAMVGVFAHVGQSMFDNIANSVKSSFQAFSEGAKAMGKNVIGTLAFNAPKINKALALAPFAVAAVGALVSGAAVAAIPALTTVLAFERGGIVTGPTLGLVGEGKDDEAVLPLNDRSFSQIARGIQGNIPIVDEETLYRAIARALKEIPAPNVDARSYLDGKEITKSVRIRLKREDARYHPVKQF